MKTYKLRTIREHRRGDLELTVSIKDDEQIVSVIPRSVTEQVVSPPPKTVEIMWFEIVVMSPVEES